MAAAAYKAVLTFRGSNGTIFRRNASCSDVVDAFFTFEDGSSELNLPSDQVYSLIDILLTGTGTDTSQTEIYKNQVYIGERVINAVNQGTTVGRQFQVAQISFSGNSKLKFKQIA